MEKITLSNGKEVLNFTPDIDGELAVVHLSVLKKLTRLLSLDSDRNIINEQIENLKKCEDIEDAVVVQKDFISFHETVNLIQTYKTETNEKVEKKYQLD